MLEHTQLYNKSVRTLARDLRIFSLDRIRRSTVRILVRTFCTRAFADASNCKLVRILVRAFNAGAAADTLHRKSVRTLVRTLQICSWSQRRSTVRILVRILVFSAPVYALLHRTHFSAYPANLLLVACIAVPHAF